MRGSLSLSLSLFMRFALHRKIVFAFLTLGETKNNFVFVAAVFSTTTRTPWGMGCSMYPWGTVALCTSSRSTCTYVVHRVHCPVRNLQNLENYDLQPTHFLSQFKYLSVLTFTLKVLSQSRSIHL